MHYANLNSGSLNNSGSYLRAVEYAISFFSFFLINVYFNEAFVKNFIEKAIIFNANFQNSFQDVVYYGILVCQTLSY